MEPAWSLPETKGPSYLDVVTKFSDKYDLRNGDIYAKSETLWIKIATKRFPGRPILKESLEIDHDFYDLSSLALSIELASLLEEEGCSDYIERPGKQTIQSLLEIINKRF